jgi:hypothetical protein
LELAAGEASADHVACALAKKELLLFIDNCEHVIEGAGTMAEPLFARQFGSPCRGHKSGAA